MSSDDQHKIVIGRFGKTFGVQGWLHIRSFSEPQDNICRHNRWLIQQSGQWKVITITEIRPHQPGFIAKIEAIDSPEQARLLTNLDIAIETHDLPALNDDEFYQHELIGMVVVNQRGETLGNVTEIMETGSNDVFIVEGQKRELIPYLDHVVICIDREKQTITVNWESLSE